MREENARTRRFAKSLRARLTDAEVILWSRLRGWRSGGCIFRRQHPIGPYVVDFACVKAKLVVELDGARHGTELRHAHDLRRDTYLKESGWQVIRIAADRVYRNLGEVLDMLAAMAVPPPPRA